MKKILKVTFIFALVLSFVSCGDTDKGPETKVLKNNFLVDGKISGAEGMTVFFETISEEGTISVAQAQVDSDAKFSIEGNIPGMGIYQLRVGEQEEMAIPLTVSEGDKIHITSDLGSFTQNTKISGVSWGEAYSKYMTLINGFGQAQQELMAQRGQVPDEVLQQRYLELKKPIDAFAKVEITKNPGSAFNIMLSNSLMPANGIKDYPKESLDLLKKMQGAFQKKYKDSPITETLSQQITSIEASYNDYQLLKDGKKSAIEIALKTPEGNELRLSSLKGKVVLIDFWASWCGPCRKENPNVVRLYNKYKNKGFTVFSVSLDEDGAKWVQAIEADGLVWPNHVSDLQGWKSPVVPQYGIQGIPHTVLIDKKGNIIEVGLRGQDLERKLESIL
jgi:thiol-disulfide isomerase/thioredoxin